MKWLFSPCRKYRRLAALEVGGALSDAERQALQRHRAACPACRGYGAALRSALSPLERWKSEVAKVEPSPANRERWANAIRAAARAETGRLPRRRFATGMQRWGADVFWPYRRAWAGLAVVWALIIAGHYSLSAPAITLKAPAAAQELMALKEQQNTLAELLTDHPAAPAAERPRTGFPKTRSARQQTVAV